MNLSQAKTNLQKLIMQYSERGSIKEIDDADVADYSNRMTLCLDIAQKNIAEVKHIVRYHKISHSLPFKPSEDSFETVQHTDVDIEYSTDIAYAYSFKIDNTADVYIEGALADGTVEIIESIYGYSSNGFACFKGIIDIPSDTEYETIKIRFSGDNFYNIKDVALLQARYNTYEDIPSVSRYIEYEMPDDMLKPLGIQIRSAEEWKPLTNFYWEDETTLAVSAYLSGELKVKYAALPVTIDDDTESIYEFELPESLQGAMLYYAAALLLQQKNMNAYSLLMQLYQEKMINYRNERLFKQKVIKRTFI